MRKMKRALWMLIAAAGLLNADAAFARGGLRTPLGEVVIKNLKIGQTYSMYKLLNLPLRIVNTGDESADIRIETAPISAATQGFMPVPGGDWVRIDQSTFTVDPNREAVTDVVLTIPNDASLLGRRFQADIWTHSTDPRALQVGLRSHILIQIDSTPPTEDELKKKFVDESVANLDFTISPISAGVTDVPIGRVVDLRKERKLAIKLINPNDRAIDFRVRSLPVWETLVTTPVGVEPAQDAHWLIPEKDVVHVEGNSIADTSLKLDIPKWAKGGSMLFVVSFELLQQKISSRVYYKLRVDTEK